MRRIRLECALIGLLLPVAAAAFNHNEAVDGDLSGDRLNPTSFVANVGSNTLTGTTQAGDLEYVHISLPAGITLGAVMLTSFVSTDNVAFIGVQEGTFFTVAPDEVLESDLLGYTHFGTGGLAGSALPGTDILDNIGLGAESIGFVPPLAGSDYTFWIQQFNAPVVAYSLDFVPEPGTTPGLLAGAALLAALARRRRR